MKRKLRIDRVIACLFLLVMLGGMVSGFIEARQNPDKFVELVMKETDRWWVYGYYDCKIWYKGFG